MMATAETRNATGGNPAASPANRAGGPGVHSVGIVASSPRIDKQAVIDRIRAALPELLTADRWVCWRSIPDPDPTKKPRKMPVNPHTGGNASSTNPATWATFAQAAGWYLRHDVSGLGFVLGDGWAGVDLDDCVDDGNLSPFAWRVIERMNSYAELSPSGKGVHILARGEPGKALKTETIEVYSHGRYFTVTGRAVTDSHIEARPAELQALVAEYAPKTNGTNGRAPIIGSAPGDAYLGAALVGEARRVAMALDGGRNDTLNRAAFSLATIPDLHESVIEGALLSAALQSGLGEPEARATIDSGVKAGRLHPRALQAQRPARRLATWTETPEPAPDDEPGEARPAALLSEGADDDGNSRCVAALYPDRFLHCDALGWLGWDGVKWAAGAESVLDGAIKTTLKTRRLAAVAAEREAIVKAATPSARRVRDARFMLGSLLHAPVDSFDGPAHLLNCQNGVVNLATGELVTHDPQAHRFTHSVNAEYNPQADRGEWLAFLRQTIGDDPDMLRFVQMAVGYSLTAETREECLFYIHGPTRSGKGTFAETLLALIGSPLALAADFATFSEQKNDTQGFALAALRPARLVFASESERYTALNPAKIKNLTGGDSITAAHKFKDSFTFRPRFKMWLFSNWPVNVDVDDDAAWYRLRVIPFPFSHAGSEDKNLKARLRSSANLAGVLAWAVEGARLWYQATNGLVTPQAIVQATRAQRDALDFVQSWLDETCVMGPGLWCTTELLYQSYGAWCKNNGVTPKGQKTLAQSLQAKGLTTSVQRKVAGVNHRVVEGLNLAIRLAE